MYNWQTYTLNPRERDLLTFESTALSMLDAVEWCEYYIAYEKAKINRLVEALHKKRMELPHQPHEVAFHSRTQLPKGFNDPDHSDLKVIYIEDYPAYFDYWKLCNEYHTTEATLKLYRKRLKREEKIASKKSAKQRKKDGLGQ